MTQRSQTERFKPVSVNATETRGRIAVEYIYGRKFHIVRMIIFIVRGGKLTIFIYL